MRFAYIDSNGNEVPIPSVDALALRIELGAITSDTELYDAQADQWGPAHTHEIFHTLSRSAEDDGFVAPPPPMAAPVPPPEPEAEEPEPAPEESPVTGEPAEAELTLADAGADDSGLTLTDSLDGSEAGDSELTIADEPEAAAPDFSGIDLAPATEGGMMAAEEPAADEEAPMSFDAPADAGGDDVAMDFGAAPDLAGDDQGEDEPEEEGSTFDFGDMGGGLELEEEFEAPGGQSEPAMDFSSGGTVGEGDGGLGIADAGGDFGGGLEQAMDFSSAGADTGGAGLDLEQPMSEFSPEAPPAWMESDGGDAGGDQVMDFSSMSSEGEAEAPGTTTRTRTPKDKPSKPKFKKERNLWPIVGGVLLVALALGGYTAWPIIQGMISDEGAEGPVVVMPAIDQALLPEMRMVSDAAYASWFSEQRAGIGTVTAAPSDDWLAGVYFANASQYEAVATFWEDVDRVLDAVEDIDLASYHAAFETALGSSAIDAANHAIVAERADSGFVAAAPSRAATFGLLADLVAAATDLHDFLVANEANIEHAPASAVTTDPILEARTTPEIREAMETRIDAVTQAQGALDFLQFPTSDELWAMMLGQIQESGIQ